MASLLRLLRLLRIAHYIDRFSSGKVRDALSMDDDVDRSRGSGQESRTETTTTQKLTPVTREFTPPDPTPADVSLGYDARNSGFDVANIETFDLEIREIRFVTDNGEFASADGGMATLSDAYDVGMVPFEPVPLQEVVQLPTSRIQSIQLVYAIETIETTPEIELAEQNGIAEQPFSVTPSVEESYDLRLFVRFVEAESGYRLEFLHVEELQPTA